jgi:uncharacterized FlaG/YvyC family protein
MRKIVCFNLLLGIALSAAAEVYRWTDNEGKTHYGDHPPQEQRSKATPVDIKIAPAGIDTEAQRQREQLRSIEEGRQRERDYEQQKAAQEQQRRAELARRCKSLQNEIRYDRDTAVFYRYDDAGNRVLWTSEERSAYREKLQVAKRAYCPDLSD